MQESIRSQYKKFRDSFGFSELLIDTTEDSYIMAAHTQSSSDFDYLFKIDVEGSISDDKLEVSYFRCIYKKTEQDWSKTDRMCDLDIVEGSAFYKVEALKMTIRKIYSESSGSSNLAFYGTVNLEDGNDIETDDTQGMDNKLIPFKMTLNEEGIDHFDKDEPEFDWEIIPKSQANGDEESQMSVNLLITSLDQNRTNETPEITPPRGISSLNKLAVESATFHSKSGKFSNLEIICTVPEFSFLPLELQSNKNDCKINYLSITAVNVEITGEVVLSDGNSFSAKFLKDFNEDMYTIYLTGADESVLTFQTIKSQIFKTITTVPTTILPADELAVEKLRIFGITEDSVELSNPTIEIKLEPYELYSISGYHSVQASDDGTIIDVQVKGNFANLDGTILSYMKFSIDSSFAEEGFDKFFDFDHSDAGLASLQVKGLSFVTINRDFDLELIDQLSASNIEAPLDFGEIMKKGIFVEATAELIEDCKEFTFCRVFKSNMIYSHYNFKGLIDPSHTVLTAKVDNFNLTSNVDFQNSILQISFSNSVTGHEHFAFKDCKLILNGELLTTIEDDRIIRTKVTWNFGDDPTLPILVTGAMTEAIHDNLFNVGLIDLTDIAFSGQIDSEGNLSKVRYSGLGIYGQECYSELNLIDALQDQKTDPIIEPLTLDNNEHGKFESQIVKDKCKPFYFKMNIDREDYENNEITGVLHFENPEDIMRTSTFVQPEDQIPSIINDIEFPHGLVLDYTYSDAADEYPMSFTGQMNFLGVHSKGQFDYHNYDNTAKGNLILPTIKIGGGNVQFITWDDLIYHYGLDKDDFSSKDLNKIAHFHDLKADNTLKFQLVTGHLQESVLLLESNLIVLNILTRVSTYLNSSLLQFNVHGNPYNGIFSADLTVEIIPAADLQSEQNSLIQITLENNDEFEDLEKKTNDLLKLWVSRVIKITEEANRLIDNLSDQLAEAKRKYIPEEMCEAYEQCIDLPSIKCEEYAQIAVCTRTQEVCLTMNQV